MEVVKPLWLAHAPVGAGGRKSGQDSSIFAVALDSAGERLATAGLDCTIRVWYTKALHDHTSPRLAAIMSRHTGAVLCVRWSPSAVPGSLLASGSDDSIVLIWQRVHNAYGNASFEAAAAGADLSAGSPSESYSVLHRLTGHESDVNGIEWSQDGKYFASCGLDGKVLIYEVSNGFALTKRLETEPKKQLKGLIWDPLGQYLAAQSNDGCLFIWRTIDWRLETIVTSPYSDTLESYTYFSRPSWSPDGRVIGMPDSLNGSDSIALLIERSQWTAEQSLVGHASSVQSISFGPRIFQKANSAEGETFLLIALGSQDGVISLWSSGCSKPIVVLNNVFEHAVMDLVWMNDGLSLIVVSYDGTAAMLQISPQTINGTMMSDDQQSGMIGKLARQQQQQNSGGLNLPTSLAQLDLQDKLEAIMKGKANDAGGMATTANDMNNDTLTTIATQAPVVIPMVPLTPAQQEMRLKSGKRRITPQLLQPATPNNGADQSQVGFTNRQESYTVVIGKPARKSWIKSAPVKSVLSLTLDKDINFEILNLPKDGCCKITCLFSQTVVWEERIESLVTCASILNDGSLICCCQNQRMYHYSPAGRRLTPPIILTATATVIASADDLLLVVLDNGLFYVWTTPSMKSLLVEELPPQGLGSELVYAEIRLLSERNDEIIVELHFAENKRLIYSSERRMFYEVEGVAAVDAVIQAIWGTEDTVYDPSLIPKVLSYQCGDLRVKSLSHIEGEIAACQVTGDMVRLVPWLCAYTQRLSLDENVAKIREVLSIVKECCIPHLNRTVASIMANSSSLTIRQLADQLL